MSSRKRHSTADVKCSGRCNSYSILCYIWMCDTYNGIQLEMIHLSIVYNI